MRKRSRQAPQRAGIAVAALALALLAGCFQPALPRPPPLPEDAFERAGPLTMTVRDARVTAGRCMDGYAGFGDECHVVRLHLDNSQSNATVETTLSWSAEDAEGGGADHGDMDGPASVGPRSHANVTVRFTVPVDSPRLVRIVFEGFPGVRAEAAVPPY